MKDFTERGPRTYAIIGAAMEVHQQLGCGFLEPVYQEAQPLSSQNEGSYFTAKLPCQSSTKASILILLNRVDFICSEEVAVELKALTRLSGTEDAQLINYLKASGLAIGLLLILQFDGAREEAFLSAKASAGGDVPFHC